MAKRGQQSSLTGRAFEVIHKELDKVKCQRIWQYGEYDLLREGIEVRYSNEMAKKMAMMSSKQKPPSLPPSQDETNCIIGDFTEITVSNYDNYLHLIQATRARFDGRMLDTPEVEIWRTVLLCIFLLSVLSSLILYYFTSLLLYIFWSQPSTNGVGKGRYHLHRQDRWKGSFPMRPIRRMATMWYWSGVGLRGLYVCIRWTVVWLF
jgi:hypothetical protein